MPDVPDVRVKLSAEGVSEVIAAMRKVQAEAKKTDGFDALKKAGEDLKSSLLDGIGVAAAIGGMVELGKTAIDNAVNIALLSEKIGTSVETLSVLSVAAKEADVSQEQMGTGLQKLARNLDQAAKGAQQPLDAFRRMGISMKDIKTNDPGQMFILLSQRMAGIEGGAKRAALAQDLLGKSGADLVPLMQKLANGGFEEVQAQARALGLELTQSTIDAIKKAHESMTDLQLIAEGVATQFVTGFAPKATDAMRQFGQAVIGQGDGMRKVGEIVGEVAKFIVFVFVAAGHIIGSVFDSIVEAVSADFAQLVATSSALFSAFKAAATGNFSQAAQTIKLAVRDAGNRENETNARQRGIYSQLGSQLKTDFSNFTSPDKNPAGSGKGGGGTDEGNLAAIQKARLAFLQAQADNELAITKLKNQLEGQENDRNYKDGLTSLQDYYDKRADLIQKDMDDEIATLQKKRKLLEAEPTNNSVEAINKQKAIEAVNAKITEAILQRDGKLKQNEDDRHNAILQHRQQELDMESKIALAEGDRDKAAKLALEEELARTEELLTKQGMAAGKIKELLDAMRSAGEGKIGFDSASRQGQQVNTDLDLAKRDIQRQVDTGQINYIQGQLRTIQLERERIDTLKQIGAEMTANAEKSKDPALIQQAKEFNAAVKDIEASTNVVGRALADLQNTAIQGAIHSFSQFVGDAVTGAQSLKDAWKALENSFRQIVAQMIAKLLELYLWMLLTKFIPGGDAASLTSPSNFAGGSNGFPLGDGGGLSFSGASGGWTGNMAPNKIAGIVHGQEYVVKAGPASRFRPLLELMNSGSMRGIAPMGGGYMSGGYVSGSGGSAVQVDIHNHTGQQVQQSSSTTPDGRELIKIVIGQVAADMAQGGQIAQTMDRVYGIRRGGVKRG